MERRLNESTGGSGLTRLQRRLYAEVSGDLSIQVADLSRPPRIRIQDWFRPDIRPDSDGSPLLRRRLERDEQGRISRIRYPNGEALVGRDASGQVNSLTITRAGQRRVFVREGNNWMLETGGMRFRYPGQVQLNEANGDISIQLGEGARRWRTEQSDGTVVNEQMNATGARVALGDGNRVLRIRRADQSTVEAFYTGNELTRITETSANGTSRVWRKQENGSWTSDGQPARRNMVLEANGNTRYQTADGVTHIIRGNGVELLEGPGRARYTFDGQGRITSLMLANGTGIRQLGYEGDTNYVNRIVINDRAAGGTKTYTRIGHSFNWIVTNAAGRQINTAIGDARIADDGTYMIRDTRHDRPGQPGAQHVWRAFGWNGIERRHQGDGNPSISTDRVVPERVTDRRPSTTVREAHDRLLAVMREAQLDAPRLARMNEMMQAFELRMRERGECRRAGRVQHPQQIEQASQQAVIRTYDQLAAMVSERGPNTFYNQQTRRFMAENFMLYAAQPCVMNQGPSTSTDRTGHGTCWEKAGQTWAMENHPDAMANLLRQVCLRGEFTTLNSGTPGSPPRTFRFSPAFLGFAPNLQETNWTLSTANDNGNRSPVGRVFDYVLPVLIGRRQGNIDAGTNGEISQIMQMVTGHRPSELANAAHRGHLIPGHTSEAVALLDHGALLRYEPGAPGAPGRPPRPGHWMSRHLQRMMINGERRWVVIDDNQWGPQSDRIVGIINNLEDFRNRGWAAMTPADQIPQYARFAVPNDTGIGVTSPTNPYRPQPIRPQPYRPQPYRPQPYRPQPIRPQPWCPT